VRDHHDNGSPIDLFLDPGQDTGLDGAVHPSQRFIQKDMLRGSDEDRGEHGPAPLAQRQLPHRMVGCSLEPEEVQGLAAFLLGPTPHPADEAHDLIQSRIGCQIRMLGEIRDPLAGLNLFSPEVSAVNQDRARIRLLHTGSQLQQRALAATVRPQEQV
jgi:hypothetical protein